MAGNGQAPTFDRIGKDDRRVTGVVCGGVENGQQLGQVMATQVGQYGRQIGICDRLYHRG